MQEISLNILDVAQNSVSAGATLIEISVLQSNKNNTLHVIIKDNGRGMTQEQIEKVTDPFYTTRTTRRVGLGVPFLKMICEMTGGTFTIESTVGVGTTISAVFCTNHIDCMPIGDIEDTIFSLVSMSYDIDFIYTIAVDDEIFVFNTYEVKEILGDVSLNVPEVALFIRNYLKENSPLHN